MAVEHTDNGIAIIDFGPVVDPESSPEARMVTARDVDQAARSLGVFYLRNHGLAPAYLAEVFAEVKRFFQLPEEVKMRRHMGKQAQFRGYIPLGGEITQARMDWHECVDIQPLRRDRATGLRAPFDGHLLDDPGQWVDDRLEFRRAITGIWDRLLALASQITEVMAVALGLEPAFFKAYESPDLCALRLMHYPPFAAPPPAADVDQGMGAHVDLGFLTILAQDEVGGLEMKDREGGWLAVSHVPDTVVVNVGLMMQRWTNDRYLAPWHRVRLATNRSRYSIPFSFEPGYDALVEPLDVCLDEANPPRYEPCRFGEFQTAYFSKAFEKV